jgi:hypothetical protein
VWTSVLVLLLFLLTAAVGATATAVTLVVHDASKWAWRVWQVVVTALVVLVFVGLIWLAVLHSDYETTHRI